MQTDWMNGYGYMGGMGFFGPFMMILWITIIIAVIVLLVRWLDGSTRSGSKSEAINILENRFARGEIDAAELETHKRQLKES